MKKIGNFGKLVEKEEQQFYLEIWGVWISELFFALFLPTGAQLLWSVTVRLWLVEDATGSDYYNKA